jgi:UrcA family protein
MTYRLSAALGRGACLSLAVGGLALIGPPAVAQTNAAPTGTAETTTVEGVTVTAPFQVEGTELVRVTRTVTTSDLDLKSMAGSVELNKRIADAAREACQSLDRHYPEATPGNASCQQRAVQSAQAQSEQVRAIAQGRVPPTAAAATSNAPPASTVEPAPKTGD